MLHGFYVRRNILVTNSKEWRMNLKKTEKYHNGLLENGKKEIK
jgi:hypothetical protein